MVHDVAIPEATSDPVATALQDATVRQRMHRQAQAWFNNSTVPASQVRNNQLVETVVQESCRRAWEKRADYDATRPIEPWLMKFVINVAYEQTRRPRSTTALAAVGPTLEELAVDRQRPFDEVLLDQLSAQELVQRLSSADQQLVRWHITEGLTFKEIGVRLGQKETTVRVRFHRLTQQLRSHAGPEGEHA